MGCKGRTPEGEAVTPLTTGQRWGQYSTQGNCLNASYSSDKISWWFNLQSCLKKEQNVIIPHSSSQMRKFMIMVKTKNRDRKSKALWSIKQCYFIMTDVFFSLLSFLWEQMQPTSHMNFRGKAEERLCVCVRVCVHAHTCMCVCFPLGHQT